MALRDRAALVQARTLLRLDGRTITYTRTTGDSVTLTAVPGESQHQEVSTNGAVLRVKSSDWLFRKSDFVTAFGAVEPADGDIIVEDGTRYILRPAGSDASATLLPGRTLYRCHTKNVGLEANYE